jgi:hypothetical protein
MATMANDNHVVADALRKNANRAIAVGGIAALAVAAWLSFELPGRYQVSGSGILSVRIDTSTGRVSGCYVTIKEPPRCGPWSESPSN